MIIVISSTFSYTCWSFIHFLLRDVCFRSLSIFNCYLSFWYFCYYFLSSLYIFWILTSCQIHSLQIVFYHSIGFSMALIICCEEAFQFDVISFVYFCLCFLCFETLVQKSFPISMTWTTSSKFSYSSFLGSSLTLKSLMHFELIFQTVNYSDVKIHFSASLKAAVSPIHVLSITNKIWHPFMIKTLHILNMERMTHNIIKDTYNKLTVNIILNEDNLKAFALELNSHFTIAIHHGSGSTSQCNQSSKSK
jgi:hypothetical protein